jgi:hypothetical protein
MPETLTLVLLDVISQHSGPVQSFIERAGISDAAQITALETLFASAVAHGWWAKCDLIYPFIGGNATAHAQNLKSAAFTITWNGTVTHDANGITGDGVTGYGNTGYTPDTSAILSTNSTHVGIYRRTNATGAGMFFLGTLRTVTLEDLFLKRTLVATTQQIAINNAAGASFAGTSLAFLVGSGIDNATVRMFSGALNGSAASVAVAVPNLPLFISAFNNGGVAAAFSNSNLAGVTCGAGLTFAEYTLMGADWQAFNTVLSRQV